MSRICTCLLTIIVNLVIGSALLIAPTRLAASGANAFWVTGTLSFWALLTAIFAYIVGRVLTERNARALVETSSILFVLTFLGFRFFPAEDLLFACLFLLGIATALFCAPLQVFLKKLEHGRSAGLVRTSALYSASWSFGMATGPFLFALLRRSFGEDAWRTAFLIDALLMGAAFFLPRLAEFFSSDAADEKTNPSAARTEPRRPDLALAGWLLTGAVFSAVAAAKTFLPFEGAKTGISEAHVGGLIAVIYYAHSFTSLALVPTKDWMYRRASVLIFSLLGGAGLILLACAGHLPCLYAGALLLGMDSGVTGFCLVFYSLAHPAKAPRYVAVNEITVALCGVAAPPLFGALLYRLTGSFAAPFLALLLPLAAAAFCHFQMIGKTAEK